MNLTEKTQKKYKKQMDAFNTLDEDTKEFVAAITTRSHLVNLLQPLAGQPNALKMTLELLNLDLNEVGYKIIKQRKKEGGK